MDQDETLPPADADAAPPAETENLRPQEPLTVSSEPPTVSPEELQTFDDPRLIDELWAEPYRFEFMAALGVLAKVAADASGPSDDPRSILDQLRFRSYQSLSFPPSEILDMTKDPRGKSLAIFTVAFLGITGPLGALPRPYTELVMQRVYKKDYALRDFLDIFNHRLIQLFAEASQKYRFYLTYEKADAREALRRAQGPQKLRGYLLEDRSRIDLFSQLLLDVGGLGTPLLRFKDSDRSWPAPRTEVSDATARYFSGLFSQSHRNALSLGQAVTEYFGVCAEIISFVGQWIQLPEEHQTCLRRKDGIPLLSSASQGALANSQKKRSGTQRGPAPRAGMCADPRLGRNTVVGSRIWELQGRFRVRLGPLTFDQFKEFMPVGGRYKVLAHLARVYAGPTFDFDIQPVLQGPEVPWCQLGAPGSKAPRLGWNTWLRNREFTTPIDDAIFPVPDRVSMNA